MFVYIIHKDDIIIAKSDKVQAVYGSELHFVNQKSAVNFQEHLDSINSVFDNKINSKLDKSNAIVTLNTETIIVTNSVIDDYENNYEVFLKTL